MAIKTGASAASSAAQRTAVAVLAAISVCHLLNDVIQSLIVALYPMIKDSLGLDFRQIGLITFTFTVTASVLQPLVGYVTDRYPTPYSLVVGMGCSLLGLVIAAFASTYGLVLVAVGLIGMGSSVFHPESSRVARLASGGQHGLAQSVFQVGGNFGTALGPLLAAFVVLPYGQGSLAWFSVVALIGMILLAGIGSWYGKTLKFNNGAPPSEREAIHDLAHGKVRKSVAILMALTFSKDFYLVSLTSFYTFYLIHTFGLSVRDAQLYLFLFLFAVAAGTVIGGPIGDRIGTRRVIWWSILGVLPFTLALPYVGLAGDRGLERDHRVDPRLRPSCHHRLCADLDPGAGRHGGRLVLWPCLRRRRHRRGLSRLARRCDQHHLCLPCVRLSAGDRPARSISAGDGKTCGAGKTKEVRDVRFGAPFAKMTARHSRNPALCSGGRLVSCSRTDRPTPARARNISDPIAHARLFCAEGLKRDRRSPCG